MTTSTAEAPAKVRRRTLTGNLTRDPELRFSANGTPWCSAGLAVTPRVQGEDGNWQDGETAFYELVCFGDLAEHAAECLHMGDRVLAYGRIAHETWAAKDGTERTTEKLVCDEVGPSVRFHTATVNRTDRRRTTRTPAEAPVDDGYGYDEEPF